MPYPERLWRCNINASTPGEQVVNTVWIQEDNDTLAPGERSVSTQDVADRVRDAWADMILTGSGEAESNPLTSYFINAMQFVNVTAYAVNTLGRSTEQAEANFAANVKGTGALALPAQCALVVTLLTGAPGRSARGRIFLGGLSNFLTPTGRVLPASQQIIVDNMAGFYRALRDEPLDPDNMRPVVVSPTTGTARRITSVQVGDVMDTMRSRRNKLVEARLAASVDE